MIDRPQKFNEKKKKTKTEENYLNFLKKAKEKRKKEENHAIWSNAGVKLGFGEFVFILPLGLSFPLFFWPFFRRLLSCYIRFLL